MPLATVITTMAVIPHTALASPTSGIAPLDLPELDAVLPVGEPPPLPVAGEVGVKTDDALAKHAVAAALAELRSEGAALLTVALPAKLQD
jgi:hypothetical protein